MNREDIVEFWDHSRGYNLVDWTISTSGNRECRATTTRRYSRGRSMSIARCKANEDINRKI
jgi:hypothetical protein